MTIDDLPPGLSPPGVVILTGPFGSGKTEIAINLARRWARQLPTYLADLDVVTPYFRPRDIAGALGEAGVHVLAPGGDAGALDAPVLPQEMAAAIADSGSGLIIDVGGQPQGAGVLAHWQEALRRRSAKMCLVVNPRRPGAGAAEALAGPAREISAGSGLPLTGIIANGNLGAHTTLDHAVEGLSKARELEKLLDAPVLAVCCPAEIAVECASAAGETPVLGLSFFIRPPWERATS